MKKILRKDRKRKISESYPLTLLRAVSSKSDSALTFVAYARARRMGLAMKQIRAGETVMDAQLSTGYESNNGFRESELNLFGMLEAHRPYKKSEQK